MALGRSWAGRHRAACWELRHTHVVDHAEAALINGAGSADQLLGVAPRHFHIQDGKVAVSRVSFHLSQTVAGRAQDLGQLNSFSRDERCQLMTESQVLLDGYSQESSAREPQPVC